MKQCKKCLCVILTILSLLPYVLTANASEISSPVLESESKAIIDVLADVESVKNIWGLADIDFSSLEISSPVYTYNYVDGILERGAAMYPIVAGERIVLFAVPNNGQFQITNGLTSEINKLINKDTPFALIYDDRNAYLYTDKQMHFLKSSGQKIDNRNELSMNTKPSTEEIKTTDFSRKVSLGYGSNMQKAQRNTNYNYSCNVSYVTQNPYSNLCWAASVACIANYKNNSSLTAASVARAYYGNTNFDIPIEPNALRERLQPYGLLYYRYSDQGNFENKIYQSISADYPVGGTFAVLGGEYHASVIFDINIISGRIQVMDPAFGMTTANYSYQDSYSYTSSAHNATLVLYGVSYDTGD